MKNEICLLFSGGIDSTLAAYILSENFDKVHLLTCQTGFILFIKRAELHFKELREKVSERKFVWKIEKCGDLFFLLRKGFVKDYLRYCKKTSPSIFCLACKLSMHSYNIIYCLENNINYSADGSVKTQSDHAEMMPQVLVEIKRLYSEYGINFLTPIYNFGSRNDERRKLRQEGFTLGIQTFGLHKTIQPLCLPGIPYGIWHLVAKPREDLMAEFVKSKKPILKEFIRKRIYKKNDLQ